MKGKSKAGVAQRADGRCESVNRLVIPSRSGQWWIVTGSAR